MKLTGSNVARHRRIGMAIWAISLSLAYVPSASATPITISGTTLGCFGAGCVTFTSPAVNGLYGLTFTGALFDLLTDPSGAATTVALGTLERGNVNVSESTAPLPFTLQLTFAQPSGLSGGQVAAFDAVIAGSTPGGGGPLAVDFDNSWRPFTFGDGSFELALLTDLDVNKNNEATIYGTFRNAAESSLTPVPEPATLLMFGAGAIGLASRMKRRR